MPIEFIVRTSLIAATVGFLLVLMRIKTAAARHAVWAGVVIAMLLLPAWLAWGPRASLAILPRSPEQRTTMATPMPAVDTPAAAMPAHSETAQSARLSANWFTIIYAAGVFTLLLRLAIGTLRTTRLTRSSCVVPVTVGFFRPRIILPQGAGDWPQARLDAVLLHERAHARRRDPLIQWIALLNRALFWFHPLVWWLERQLSRLAEEACDAAVLANGHDPHDYSEYLLDLSRSVELAGKRVYSPAVCMPGPVLRQRIHKMLSGTITPRLSRPRLALTIAACAVAAAVLSSGALVRAQSNNPKFEVASVKPYVPDANVANHMGLDHRRFRYVDSLFGIILKAYGIRGCGNGNMPGVDCALLTGGPSWIHDSVFSIQATAPDNIPDYTFQQFWTGQAPQFNLMLQALLADRFHLKLRREQKQLAVYALSVVKNGPKPKLKKADAAGEPSLAFSLPPAPKTDIAQLTVKNRSMQHLAAALTNVMGRPVLDQTGLSGQFDFTMEYEADLTTPGLSPLAGPSLFAALQNELGLKLESTKGPVEVLVIDHVEQPSPN